MKKWHLEEVLHIASQSKIILPDSAHPASSLHMPPAGFREENKFVVWCRSIAGFLIRVF